MTFGKQSGPPASARQVMYLLDLVVQAGHEGFRDARHPLGLTQRQAGGKFTRAEASELIDRLVAGEGGAGDESGGGVGDTAASAAAEAAAAEARLDAVRAEALAGMPAEALAAELERRGWQVMAP
ncbi:MAG TPA: hypothetical protein VK306_12655 [Acidimicrobiales bacterium]|nr:hypothetical protein [Acidimicrobiales bacterium]